MVTGISWKKDMIPMTNGPGRTRSHLPPSERGDAAERQGGVLRASQFPHQSRALLRTEYSPTRLRREPPLGGGQELYGSDALTL